MHALDLLRRYHTRRTSLRRIGVVLTHIRPLTEQRDLFLAAEDDMTGQLTGAIDRVRGKFGFNALTVGATTHLLGRVPRDLHGDGFTLFNPALTL